MHHHTENEERGVNLSFLNVSRPGEFSRVEPQAPLLEVAFRQSLHVSGLRPCSPEKHKTLISQRARICDWTSKALKACLMGWDHVQQRGCEVWDVP